MYTALGRYVYCVSEDQARQRHRQLRHLWAMSETQPTPFYKAMHA